MSPPPMWCAIAAAARCWSMSIGPPSISIPRPLKRRSRPRTRGIIAVHLYGHPAEMDQVRRIAQRHQLFVVEDASEAHGAEYRGARVGGLGGCAAFSFYGNKIVTTGEGGMVTTNDDVLADKVRLYRGQGVSPHKRYWFDVVGYNSA